MWMRMRGVAGLRRSGLEVGVFGLVWFGLMIYGIRHLVGRVLASFGGGGWGVINGEHVLFLLFMAEGVGGWMDV